MYRLFIAEDEPKLRTALTEYFQKNGFLVNAASDGTQAIKLIETEEFDLAILDIMMPGADGFQVCKDLRRKSDVPVIFLTARTAEEDQLKGFQLDADDYVTKPFSLPVLKARVEALMHRYKGRSTDQLLTAPGIVCDPQARTIVVDGKTVDMPPKVFSLLVFLMENKGRILTREQILDRVWGSDSIIYDRAVDGTIKKLRRLLGDRSGYIHTIIKVGYRFEEDRNDATERR